VSGALDFLSPSLARPEHGFDPVSRSAVEHLYRAAGAVFEERDGWLVPTAVPGEAERLARVGLADLSSLCALDVRPAPAALDGATTYRLSPRRALVLVAPSRRAEVEAGLPDGALVVDVSAAYTVLGVSGPEARALLARLTHLHAFPAGGEVAHVTAHVLPAGAAGYRLVVAQELGRYLADVALECAEALGGGLVGVDALPAEERA
jgi:sarcosine oxidase gamma subunit